jgi:ABC-2 type transport system ATP-binding protein
VTDPDILFLDEPTVGLDVHAARQVRKTIVNWMSENPGKTVFLTTHYMAEADELCDRIAIIDGGRIIACDTPSALRNLTGGESTYRLVLSPAPTDLSAFESIDAVNDPYLGRRDEIQNTAEVKFTMADESMLTSVLESVKAQGITVQRFAKEQISLEDLFVKLVGRRLKEGE